MQIQSLRIKSYRSWKVDTREYSVEAKEKYQLLNKYQQLRNEGASEKVILSVLGLSRSTLYRIKQQYARYGVSGLEPKSTRPHHVQQPKWDKSLEALVLRLRQQEPTWGKNKIHRLLVRDHGVATSLSTVGRIIHQLISRNQVKLAYFAAQKNKPKRRRQFTQHAIRWRYDMKAINPGEMLQIDHMTIYSNSAHVKHFKAVCPVSRFMVCEVYQRATSRTAALFLQKVIQQAPFKIKSIQVDGGSEFMKDFEALCQTLGVTLLVLPPRAPKYNGKVERCNGITRDDFYSQYRYVFNLPNIRMHLQHYQEKYNTYRPHQALHNLTPMEYLGQLQNRAA